MAVAPARSVFRYRVCFGKSGLLRFTSHLDLLRGWERLLRRAHLPLVYSHGFHPRPKLQLFSALPLGYTSDAELIDLFTEEEISPSLLAERLAAVAPPGWRILATTAVPVNAPAVDRRVHAAVYFVTLPDDMALPPLQQAIATLLSAATWPRQRRQRSYDLRPLIHELSLQEGPGAIRLQQTLAHCPSAIGRADEILLALGLDPLTCLIHRHAFLFDRHAAPPQP